MYIFTRYKISRADRVLRMDLRAPKHKIVTPAAHSRGVKSRLGTYSLPIESGESATHESE